MATTSEPGRTATNFSVTPGGSASFSIPLWTPPGVGAAQPALALHYDSRSANGPLGMGWSVSGLSSITRCPSTYARNGAPAAVSLTASDHFCLDGQPLILTSGTYGAPGSTYATEMESFARIVAGSSVGNGPGSFTVTSKKGAIYTYGGTTDARLQAGTNGAIRTWSVSQIADRVGNKISFGYQQDVANGTSRIDHIDYPTTATGQGPFYRVQFVYNARPSTDLPSAYVAGYLSTEPYRLTKINVSAYGGELIKTYNLEYNQGPVTGRSRLVAVQECGRGEIGCLAPTTIGYSNGAAAAFATSVTVPPPNNDQAFTYSGCPVYPLDVNGDGRSDLLHGTRVTVSPGWACRWNVRFATATGFSNDVPLNLDSGAQPVLQGNFGRGQALLVPVQSTVPGVPSTYYVVTYNATTNSFAATTTSVQTVPTATITQAADIDGDGQADLISYNQQAGQLQVRLNTTAASGAITFAASTTVVASDSLMHYMRNGTQQVADFNGDGRADILALAATDGSSHVQKYLWLYVSNGSTNGIPNPMTLIRLDSWDSAEFLPYLLDWNGDGCTDYALGTAIHVSTCNAGFAPMIVWSTDPAMARNKQPSMAADIDGDGRDDLMLFRDNGQVSYVRSTGIGFEVRPDGQPIPLGINVAGPDTTYLLLDYDGDGRPDLGSYRTEPTLTLYPHQQVDGDQPSADVASTFIDGYGMKQTVAYTMLTEPTAYTKGVGATFPEVDLQTPTYVVRKVSSSSGASAGFGEPFYQQSYTYAGARANVQGRGFEGFTRRTIKDSRNGIETHERYLTEFPYTGMLVERTVLPPVRADDTRNWSLRWWSATVELQTWPGLDGTRYFPVTRRTTDEQREIGAKGFALVASTVTENRYQDGYGNLTSATTWITDRDNTAPSSPFYGQTWSTTVTNVYANNPATWCLGMLQDSTVTNNAPGQPAISMATAFTIDSTKCRTTAQTVAVGTPLATLTTYGFDSCGNINATTVNGRNADGTAMLPRLTTINYGARCQLPEVTTNALGETTRKTYDYGFGTALTETDANNLVTTYVPDRYGRTIWTYRPDGTSTLTEYGSCDRTACYSLSDLRSKVTTFDYGADNSLIKKHVVYSDGVGRARQAQSLHALATNQTLTTDSMIYYDALGQRVREDQPGTTNGYRLYTYDLLNRKLSDALFRPNGTRDRETVYTYLGQTTEIMDALMNLVTQVRDVTGKLRRVKDPAPGGTTNFTYDARGLLVQTVDAIDATSSQTYNILGARTAMQDADMGSWTFTPNSLGEVTSWTDAKQQQFAATFDALGRMRSRTAPEGTSTWTYGSNPALHAVGKLTAMAGNGYHEYLTYDAVGRLSNRQIVTDQNYAFDYSYNAQGLLDKVLYPESPVPDGHSWPSTRVKVKHIYSYGQLTQIMDETDAVWPTAPLWTLNSANDYGSPLTQTFGGSWNWYMEWVNLRTTYKPWTNEVTALQANEPGRITPIGSIQNLAYDWDVMGNLRSRTDVNRGLTETFVPDALNRLWSSQLNGVSNLVMSYDAAGNITSRSDVGAYTYDVSRPHAVVTAGTQTYTYDANGNVLTKNGVTQTLASNNLPTQLSNGVHTSSFAYTPDRVLYKQVAAYPNGVETTWYIGDELEKVSWSATGLVQWRHKVATPNGNAVVIVRDSNLKEVLEVQLTDHLGSLATIASPTECNNGCTIYSGVNGPTVQASFSAFGARRDATTWSNAPLPAASVAVVGQHTRHGFTGHNQLDNLGLVHMGGRVYDPAIGRFMSRDPLVQAPGDSQALNAYSYVRNRPMTLTDPSGLIEGGGGDYSGPLFATSVSGGWYGLDFGFGAAAFNSFGTGFAAPSLYDYAPKFSSTQQTSIWNTVRNWGAGLLEGMAARTRESMGFGRSVLDRASSSAPGYENGYQWGLGSAGAFAETQAVMMWLTPLKGAGRGEIGFNLKFERAENFAAVDGTIISSSRRELVWTSNATILPERPQRLILDHCSLDSAGTKGTAGVRDMAEVMNGGMSDWARSQGFKELQLDYYRMHKTPDKQYTSVQPDLNPHSYLFNTETGKRVDLLRVENKSLWLPPRNGTYPPTPFNSDW